MILVFGKPLMGIFGLHGSRSAGLMKMGEEIMGQWSPAEESRLFSVAVDTAEDSADWEDGHRKGI